MIKDIFGKELKVGDIIVFSSCNSTQVAIVRGIEKRLHCVGLPNVYENEHTIKLAQFNTDGDKVWLWNNWPRHQDFIIIDRSSLPENFEKCLVRHGY